jgi:hypothetical protein
LKQHEAPKSKGDSRAFFSGPHTDADPASLENDRFYVRSAISAAAEQGANRELKQFST